MKPEAKFTIATFNSVIDVILVVIDLKHFKPGLSARELADTPSFEVWAMPKCDCDKCPGPEPVVDGLTFCQASEAATARVLEDMEAAQAVAADMELVENFVDAVLNMATLPDEPDSDPTLN